MKAMTFLLAAFAVTGMASANLLTNGNFNEPASGEWPTGWSGWSWGSGWANHENNAGVSYDGSYYLVAGAAGGGGGGFHQTVSAAAGTEYTLSVLSGADAWWLPTGQMIMFFLNDAGDQVGVAQANTVDPAVYGENYDIPHPWAGYSLTAVAPEGTTQIKVELACNPGTGSVWFENAVLVPEPLTPALLGLGGLFMRRRG